MWLILKMGPKNVLFYNVFSKKESLLHWAENVEHHFAVAKAIPSPMFSSNASIEVSLAASFLPWRTRSCECWNVFVLGKNSHFLFFSLWAGFPVSKLDLISQLKWAGLPRLLQKQASRGSRPGELVKSGGGNWSSCFTKPFGGILEMLGGLGANIERWLEYPPCLPGMFILTGETVSLGPWEAGAQIRLARSETYWGGFQGRKAGRGLEEAGIAVQSMMQVWHLWREREGGKAG